MTSVASAIPPAPDPDAAWSPAHAESLYRMRQWGKGCVAVNAAGDLVVQPDKDPSREVNLRELVEGLRDRDIHTPVLVRFKDAIAHRIGELHRAFSEAIAEQGYQGRHHGVYPIKVNQQRHIVEEIRDAGATYGMGLEAGSKPELLAVLGLTAARPDTPIICNGFKDDEFIETVVLAAKLGRPIVPIVEKFSELDLIIKHAQAYDVRPTIGLRVKLSNSGAGRWGQSAGARSKFGLFISEALAALERLREHGMEDCLRLLHCHIGSQVCDIRPLKLAVSELTHVYAEMRRLGAGVDTLDIGGGLGVDYDGSQSATDSSVNYTMQEYASDVVYRVKAACDHAGAPHPTIVTESGRALVAYSSVLIFDTLGVATYDVDAPIDEIREAVAHEEDGAPPPLQSLLDTWSTLHEADLAEAYHDAVQARDEIVSLFTMGYVSLPIRALGERLFWAIGRAILDRAEAEGAGEAFADLSDTLSDIYFCNMSVFQSMPDAWAIDQVFPICPIQRLDERPARRGVIADITCDSDGKIDRFVGERAPRSTLPLHALRDGEPYHLAAFLVGAYQEILGDLHNLLGDTHAVHLHIDRQSEVVIDEIIRGDSVAASLGYVQIDHAELKRAMRREVERAVRSRTLSVAESQALMRFYTEGLHGYTYLEEEAAPSPADPSARPHAT